MEISEVENLIKAGVGDSKILVEGEGCNFSVVVVSEQFEGLSLVKKQQTVLATLKDQLATGELHAVSVKAYTPKEWEAQGDNRPDPGLLQIK